MKFWWYNGRKTEVYFMEMPTQPKENLADKLEGSRHHYAYCSKHGYSKDTDAWYRPLI